MANSHLIMTAISEGSTPAFREFYQLFAEKVYNTALSYAQHQQDAEEISQEVFLRIHKYAGNFKGQSSLNTWVYRITVNASLDFIKRRNKRSFGAWNQAAIETPDFVHPGVLLEKKEMAGAMYKAIETLPDSQKTAFILSFLEDLPRQEVAHIMDLSLKAVESLLQRAKQNLRKKLGNMYDQRVKSRQGKSN
ncbi:MAG: RNA polymerase sigma factor [Bacteroidota bacterium]